MTVAVAVAMAYPPRHHETIYVTLEAANEQDGILLAAQVAATNPGIVMPVGAEIIAATY